MDALPQSLASLRLEMPVFIWAPTGRCGTGLLQRLVSSSKEVLVFGEDRFFVHDLPRWMLVIDQAGPSMHAAAQALASGDVSRWCPDALPSADAYGRTLLRSFFDLVVTYAEGARSLGYARWGTKLPTFAPGPIQHLRRMLPRARHVFIYRHIEAVLRSYKARKWIHSRADVDRVCQEWVQAMVEAAQQPDLTIVCYEQLIANPDVESLRLKERLELSYVDETVFSHKVNTWKVDAPECGLSLEQYVHPVALEAAERDLMVTRCEPVMALAGYPSLRAEGGVKPIENGG